MKVGLNATCLNDRPSGAKQRFVGIYRELVKRLPDAEFVVYEPADCRVASWFDGAPNVSARRTPLPSEGRARRFLAGLRYWSSVLPQERFDVFECLHLPAVQAPTGRTLLTIHDVRGLLPENMFLGREVYKSVLARSLESVDHVIAVSEFTRSELLKLRPSLPVSVIYNGLDAGQFDGVTDADLSAFKRKYELPDEFVLAVGHFESRKNYPRLIDAITLLRDRGFAVPLLIVGNDSGGREAVKEQAAAARLTQSVFFLSGISDKEVLCAYKLCRLFIFPSYYEGFGIPILEAMAAGRPIVLSDVPVFREITQNHGVYFPHHDAELMATAIENTLASASERARLVDYGNERIKAFSFQNLAAQVETLYRSLI